MALQQLKHPDYDTLPIYVATSTADKAVAGAFFVTVKDKMLSHIASNAYGVQSVTTVHMINESKYNMANCVYRKLSSSCSSAKVSGALAPQNSGYGAGAWLSLCPGDKDGVSGAGLGTTLGTKFQVIWIPTGNGEEPWDLEKKTPGSGDVGVVVPPPSGGNSDPKMNFGLPKFDLPGFGGSTGGTVTGGGEGGSGGEPVPEPEPEKAGFPWWIGAILGLGAITTVVVFALRDKKRRKKRK